MTAMDSLFPGLYVDHPGAPIAPRDPLADFAISETVARDDQPKLAFAARWGTDPDHAWSGTAASLLRGLRQVTQVEDIGLHPTGPAWQALRLAYARRRNGRVQSAWEHSRAATIYGGRVLRAHAAARGADGYDAVVMAEDALASLPMPFYVYIDYDWPAMLASCDAPERFIALQGISKSRMNRMVSRQRALFEQAAGIFTVSRWMARSLVSQGLPPSKLQVVQPGMNTATDSTESEVRFRERPRRRLLYVGRSYRTSDIYRKGGDLVVDAVPILRREFDPELTLTMAGVSHWPTDMAVPDGVTMLGPQTPAEVRALYHSHDLLVMPSRRESFGLVFAEAQARGLPCVARNAYAMPEIVVPGLSGALIEHSEPRELADAIAAVLANDQIYKNVYERAPRIAEYFSWQRAARDITDVIARHLA